MNEKMNERLFLSSFSQSILKDKKSQFKRLRDKYLYVIHKKKLRMMRLRKIPPLFYREGLRSL
jgi:hypothetical protein